MTPSVRTLALSLPLVAACSSGAAPGEPTSRDVEVSSVREALAEGALLPDIVEEPPRHLGIWNQQQREVLRFTSTHWNAGPGVLQVRGGGQIAPCDLDESGTVVHYDQCTFATQEVLDAGGNVVYSQPAGVAVFHPEHNHWHQNDVANFIIRAGAVDGPVVGMATKITYCLIDFDKSDLVHENSTREYFDCNSDLQGISPGWGDEYHHELEGQGIDVTTLPPGTYFLTHDADPENHWIETRDDNNGSWVKFALSRNSNAKVTVLEESPCEGIACGNTANK